MVALALLIAALIVFVLALFGTLTIAKMIALGLALTVGALIVDRIETEMRR